MMSAIEYPSARVGEHMIRLREYTLSDGTVMEELRVFDLREGTDHIESRVKRPPSVIGFALEDSKKGVVMMQTGGVVRVEGLLIDNYAHVNRWNLERIKAEVKDSSRIRKPTRKEWRRIIDA